MIKIVDEFFTATECDEIAKTVIDNQNQWYVCPWTNMYILGNSLFRKINFGPNGLAYGNYFESPYFDTSAVDLLKTKLGRFFNRIEFIPGFSRPGFQVIKLNEHKTPSVWHYDDMLTCFPFERYFTDFTGNFNEYFDQKLIFTTVLNDGNYSFDYYPETLSEFGANYADSRIISPICSQHRNLVGDVCSNPNCTLHDFKTVFYTKGTMLIQEERVLHRVGLQDLNGSEQLRITLQGYGLVKNDILYLVW